MQERRTSAMFRVWRAVDFDATILNFKEMDIPDFIIVPRRILIIFLYIEVVWHFRRASLKFGCFWQSSLKWFANASNPHLKFAALLRSISYFIRYLITKKRYRQNHILSTRKKAWHLSLGGAYFRKLRNWAFPKNDHKLPYLDYPKIGKIYSYHVSI